MRAIPLLLLLCSSVFTLAASERVEPGYLDLDPLPEPRVRVSGAGVVDAVASEAAHHDQLQASELRILVAGPTGRDEMALGLREWERDGGLGSFVHRRNATGAWLQRQPAAITTVSLAGTGHPPRVLSNLVEEIGRHDRAEQLDLVIMTWSPRDLSSGREREYVAGPPRPVASGPQATITVRFGHSEPTANRFDRAGAVARQPGSRAGLDRLEVLPGRAITVPTIDYTGVRTSVAVPAGMAGGSTGVVGTGAPNVRIGLSDPAFEMVRDRLPHPRSPELAFAAYRETLRDLAAAYPDLTLVWTTAPLVAGDNTLRREFNALVRGHVADHGGPLLDLAVLLADEAGATLDPAWAHGSRGDQGYLNDAGRQRLMTAFAELLARLEG